MRVRSPGLLALSLALLVSGMSLAGVLHRDGQVLDTHALLAAGPGDDLTVQSTVEGIAPDQWQHLAVYPLGNHTYTAAQDEELWLVATSAAPLPVDAPVVLDATVMAETLLEDGRTLVLVHVDRFQEPLVFR